MKPIDIARAALAQIPKCGARARSTGLPCQKPGVGAGGRCRHHGGKSTGRPPIHGKATKAAKLQKDWMRLLLGLIHESEGDGKRAWFRPGRMTLARAKEVLRSKGIALKVG